MNKSTEIEKIATALSKLQGEITDVHKDKKGYGYNYADLSQVLEIGRPLLSKYGLSISQLLYSKDEKIGVETALMHESGQWISSKVAMTIERGKSMSLAQAAGSVVTYLRRYALAAILGICQTDNDARLESVEPSTIRAEVKKPKEATNELHALKFLLHKFDVPLEKEQKWLKAANVSSLEELSKEQIQKIIDMLEKNNIELNRKVENS